MSLRAFTVFQDAPASTPTLAAAPKQSTILTRSAARRISEAENATGELLDKENLNPVTGLRVQGAPGAVKKRKTTVLATKVQPEPTTGKATKTRSSDSATEPEKKKRKASATSTASSSKAKPKAKSSSTKKTATTSKAKRASGKRSEPALPRVPEEEEQAQIDSRCYDLTVKPLADVSEAYYDYDEELNPAPVFEDAPFDPQAKFATVKAASVEPEIRDYIEDPQVLLMPSKRLPSAQPLCLEDLPEPRAFSTPERKKIYAAFTFSSPSASSGKLSFTKGSVAHSRSGSTHASDEPL